VSAATAGCAVCGEEGPPQEAAKNTNAKGTKNVKRMVSPPKPNGSGNSASRIWYRKPKQLRGVLRWPRQSARRFLALQSRVEPGTPLICCATYGASQRRHSRRYFYKYVTGEVAQIVLATRKLRWSSPGLFDDPFDVPINLELPFAPAELQVAVTQRIADMIESGTPLREPRLAAMQQHLEQNRRDEVIAQIVAEFRSWPTAGINLPTLTEIQQHWERLRPDMRILCFSEAPDITPMWSHYSDSRRGAVLEFDCDDEIDSALHVAREVTYRPNPPRLPPLAD
jgi:hypothetical protein